METNNIYLETIKIRKHCNKNKGSSWLNAEAIFTNLNHALQTQKPNIFCINILSSNRKKGPGDHESDSEIGFQRLSNLIHKKNYSKCAINNLEVIKYKILMYYIKDFLSFMFDK